MDKFIEYDFDRGWWMELELTIGMLVSKVPELSARKGNGMLKGFYEDFDNHELTKTYSELRPKGNGEYFGENDKK